MPGLTVTHEDRAYERRVPLTEQAARTETSPIRQVLGFSQDLVPAPT
jgi:hypothetical protein